MKSSKQVLPGYAYHWLGTTFLAAAAPLAFQLSPVICGGLFLLIAWRWRAAVKGAERPGMLLRVLVVLGGAAAVVVLHKSLLGLEAGLSFFLVLVTAKFLEMRTPREFLFLTYLMLFLALSTLFFQQNIVSTVYVILASLLVFATALRFGLGPGPIPSAAVLRPILGILFQAVPLVLVLFLFFPRSRGGFILRLTAPSSLMGMSDDLDPGGYASLSGLDELAFRADFPKGNMPPMQEMYWRGVVLWQGDGLHWSRGALGWSGQQQPPWRGIQVVQRITLEPHGRHWLFALDHPVSTTRESRMMAGAFLETHGAAVNIRPAPYEVVSCIGPDPTPLTPDVRAAALQLPMARVSQKTQELVEQWRKTGGQPEEIVKQALKYFNHENFRYTTHPGAYPEDGLDQFLFRRRAGFCEHYAAAFSTLMRVAGIPSRVVGGYRGGRYNSLGDYLAVYQTDAHAWCEVWLENKGWVRVDPSDAIDPSRVSMDVTERAGADVYRAGQRSGAVGRAPGGVFETTRLLWDNLNYHWDLWVLGYDQETQNAFFSILGFSESPVLRAGLIIGVSGATTLVLVSLFVRRKRMPRDPVLRAYHRFCGRFARAGFPRHIAEGPTSYGDRLRAAFPESSGPIGEVIETFVALRYGNAEVAQTDVHRRMFAAKCARLRPGRLAKAEKRDRPQSLAG